MIDKPKRPKQPNIQERQPPRTLQELINRYDLDNTKIYDFLDELVDALKSKEEAVDEDISTLEQGQTDLQNQINDKNIITAGMSSNLTLSSTGDTKIPLNSIKTRIGNKLSISNNRINIGQGIAHVKVSCQIYVNRSSGAGGAFNINIRKNGSDVASMTNSGVPAGGNRSDNLSSELIPVQPNDYIEYYFYGYSGDVVRYGTGTYITVEAVD